MMQKISLKNDYSQGAHPALLRAIEDLGTEVYAPYGYDRLSDEARRLIRHTAGLDEAPVYFISGATQANRLVIHHLLKPFEAVISAETAHIQHHETGAIEAAGRKILTMPPHEGKVTVEGIRRVLDNHTNYPHVVRPRMVYISQATETGTAYSAEELERLSSFCRANGLYLFADGARLGAAVAGGGASLQQLARTADVFTIGGTKNGGLCGEAIVFARPDLAGGFDFLLKQYGALLAKGFVLGAQFKAFFTGGLYFDLAARAVEAARRIGEIFRQHGYELAYPVQSNLVFPVVPAPVVKELERAFDFYVWDTLPGDRHILRLVTTWATPGAHLDMLDEMLSRIKKNRIV